MPITWLSGQASTCLPTSILFRIVTVNQDIGVYGVGLNYCHSTQLLIQVVSLAIAAALVENSANSYFPSQYSCQSVFE